MEKIIIHSDLNNFYASVERAQNPSLEGKPIAVCGDEAARHGIVLAKSEQAKKFGVATGDAIWQAKRKCPDIVIVPPHFDLYIKYSRRVRDIYAQYTDLIENYGIDECWLDLSSSGKLFPPFGGSIKTADGEHYSEEYLRFLGDCIRNEVKSKTALTVSCGVSFNKVFAKLGSDLKKPDGTTVISAPNFKNVVNGLPVEDLLYVGEATRAKLAAMGITTIGKLAAADDDKIYSAFGKTGATLLKYARGQDDSPVRRADETRAPKSIGNSCTYPEDITSLKKAERYIYVLSESVAARLRESGMGLADTVHLWVRGADMKDYQFQVKVRHTALCGEIAAHAYALFAKNFQPPFAVRSLGVTVSGFDGGSSQVTFDEACGNYNKREAAERCVDKLRKKYGYSKIQRGIVAEEPSQMKNDVKSTHLIKPAKIDYPDDGE